MHISPKPGNFPDPPLAMYDIMIRRGGVKPMHPFCMELILDLSIKRLIYPAGMLGITMLSWNPEGKEAISN